MLGSHGAATALHLARHPTANTVSRPQLPPGTAQNKSLHDPVHRLYALITDKDDPDDTVPSGSSVQGLISEAVAVIEVMFTEVSVDEVMVTYGSISQYLCQDLIRRWCLRHRVQWVTGTSPHQWPVPKQR